MTDDRDERGKDGRGEARKPLPVYTDRAIAAFFRGRKEAHTADFDDSKLTTGDHISLMKKHPKLFG